ncbi:putative mitogen-activated protein kinase MpkA [Serendipita vermifera]|nr:putative mitogen-activated protein kinase MpkA [Serendipita vermifera]
MSARSSSSSPSAGVNGGSISGPHSPPPDENRGRSRTRQPVQVATTQPSGYHTFHSMGRKFTVESRWKLVREMGIGAFGAVVCAQDTISGEHVAVKQINRVYDKPDLAKRVLREITLLRHFQTHDNITGLIDLDSLSKFSSEIYIFMEPMEADLHQIIRSGQDLSMDHIAYFVYQIVSAMNFVHGCHVVHRDLKPGNILVNATCEIRICDFGLARGYEKYFEDGEEQVTHMTEYVATRWYRAPEIMLGFENYDEAIDVWSIGCIFGELLNGKPIFPGRDYVDQLKCIFEYLGSPNDDIVRRIARGRARKYVRSLPIYRPKPFNFPKGDEQALDLMYQMIRYKPEARITAAKALEHPWLAAFYDPEEEEWGPKSHLFTRWKEIESLNTVEEFRNAIWEEIQEYRAQARSLADHSMSPVTSLRPPVPTVREPIPEEPEPDESTESNEPPITPEPPEQSPEEPLILQKEPSPVPSPQVTRSAILPSTIDDSVSVPIPRPRKISQHPDPYATFSRRSSAIFGNPSHSPAASTVNLTPSRQPSFAHFPVLDDGDEPTPSVAVPVRSRLPSMVDGGQYRHLRTLSTVSIQENAGRPGGLAAIALIGKYVGAAKTAGADAPPSSPPAELRHD